MNLMDQVAMGFGYFCTAVVVVCLLAAGLRRVNRRWEEMKHKRYLKPPEGLSDQLEHYTAQGEK